MHQPKVGAPKNANPDCCHTNLCKNRVKTYFNGIYIFGICIFAESVM